MPFDARKSSPIRGFPGRVRRPARCLLPALLTGGLLSCADAARRFGPDPAAAGERADGAFTALALRYTYPVRSPKYELARERLTHAAMVPSRVFNDTAVWSALPSPTTRMLTLAGSFRGGRYRKEVVADPPAPAALGDQRHRILLTSLGDGQYTWDTNVDFGIGALQPDDLGAVVAGLLASAEGRDERTMRADYRAAFPRSTQALGRLFSIDTVRSQAAPHGTSNVTLTIGFHPHRIRERFPALAEYLERYVNPAKYRFTLMDRSGAIWMDLRGGNQQLDIRARTLGGRMVPLYGPPREMPDTMQLRVDVSLKVRIFTVGFRSLMTDFVITKTPQERSWTIIARREPDWDLPLATERLVRTPLRRPFEGAGSSFKLGVYASPDGQSIQGRRLRLAVQESAILRFMGRMGSQAMSDLSRRVEVEEALFLREAFSAIAADARALGGAAPAAMPAKQDATGP